MKKGKRQNGPRPVRRIGRRRAPVLIALALLLTAAGCAGAPAAPETGGDTKTEAPAAAPGETMDVPAPDAEAFRRYYLRRAETDGGYDYSRMALDGLDAMAAGAAGTAIETGELTIEAEGVLVSGHSAEILLRVTAGEMDSLLYDNGTEHLKNYRFGDETALLGRFSLEAGFYELSHRYSYSDECPWLAPNQLELHYWIVGKAPFMDRCTIPLTDFGYYKENTLEFVPAYKGVWNLEIPFVPAADTARGIELGQEFTADGHAFSVERVELTPLTCTIFLGGPEGEELTNEVFRAVYDPFWDGSGRGALKLSDGTSLTDQQFWASGQMGEDPVITIVFCAPIPAEDVASLEILGTSFPLSGGT